LEGIEPDNYNKATSGNLSVEDLNLSVGLDDPTKLQPTGTLNEDKERFQTLPDRINTTLTRLAGSQQFSNSVRSLMNREVMASLTDLTNYNLVTQTGRTIEELGFSLGLDYTLTKLPPLSRNEGQADENEPIKFNLEVTGRLEPRPDLAAGSIEQPLEGEITPRFQFSLTYNPLNGQTAARLQKAEIKYNIHRAGGAEN
jgi:hypothetical protein